MRRAGVLVAVVTLLSSILVLDAQALLEPPTPEHQCSELDKPETGLQGDVPRDEQAKGAGQGGFNCGLSLVSREILNADGRTPTGNWNMGWSKHCAYVTGPGTTFGEAKYVAADDDPRGVAVIDVSDPTNPEHVRTLKGRAGSTQVAETIFAVDAPGRSVLVVGQYGNSGSGNDKPMDVYDVTANCADPLYVGTVIFPENIHNLTISGNGRYVFATQPLQVVDLDPLFDGDSTTSTTTPRNLDDAIDYPLVGVAPVADLDDAVPAARKSSADYSSHQVWSSFDGTRLYMGGQLPAFEVFTIVDIGEWLQDPSKRAKVLSQRSGRGHSVTKARSVAKKGVKTEWVMHAEESVFSAGYGCISEEANPFAGPAEPWFSDVTDPTNPRMHVSRFGLEINRPENCAAQADSRTQASVHYHEFDNEGDANFAIISMQNAGIRVVDVRNPAHPVEVAYFNPGMVEGAPGDGYRLDKAWGHPRYVPETGHIWFSSETGGFWVVELAPELRERFGFKGLPDPQYPQGRPGTDGQGGGGTVAGAFALTGPRLATTPEAPPTWCVLAPVASQV